MEGGSVQSAAGFIVTGVYASAGAYGCCRRLPLDARCSNINALSDGARQARHIGCHVGLR